MLLPKRIARNNPEKTAYRLVNIVWLTSKINYPFEKLIHASTHFFATLFGITENDKNILTEKEIKMMILEGKDQGIVDKVEKEIAFNALKFNDLVAKNIMIPKDKISFINIEESQDKILENIATYSFTRIPVYKENVDNIIGMLNIKDIAIEYAKNKKIELDINQFLRPITFVDKDSKVSTIFKNMQLNKLAMVIVVDSSKKVVRTINN